MSYLIIQTGTQATLLGIADEIRYDIYKRVLIYDTPIPLFHFRPAALTVLANDDLDDSLLMTPKQGARLRASKHALVHTCRQTYRECSSIYYSQNAFHILSGVYLRDFINSHQPIHIQTIRKLAVRRLENATGEDLGMLLRSPLRPYASDYLENLTTMEILGSFHSLEELHLHADLSVMRVSPCVSNWIAFLSRLVEAAQGLPNLKSIVISTRSRLSMYPIQASWDVNSNDVPGWAYSFDTGHYIGDIVMVKETLKRVHGPLLLPAGKRKDRISERIDSWLQSQRTFPR